MSIRTIGYANGGVDCPGLNIEIRGVVKTLTCKYGWRVIGIPLSSDGLIWPEKCSQITLNAVGGVLRPTAHKDWRHSAR
jgi:6-phosphofructokinase